MTLLALTGGIASGKSTIAKRFVELGAIHVDADQLAREAVEPGSPGLASIVSVFGTDMLQKNGTLDRAKLGAHVFSDPHALQQLNHIVHPEVRRLASKRIAAAIDARPAAVVLYDVPLLAESNERGEWDAVILAEAPIALRLERLVQLRGMSIDEAQNRMDHQASDSDRRKIADVVIDTSGSLCDTFAQVDSFWSRVQDGAGAPAARPDNDLG